MWQTASLYFASIVIGVFLVAMVVRDAAKADKSKRALEIANEERRIKYEKRAEEEKRAVEIDNERRRIRRAEHEERERLTHLRQIVREEITNALSAREIENK